MDNEYFSILTDYMLWVNGRLINWIDQINEEQWMREIDSSFNSVEKTTLHLVSAEKVWVDFWSNTNDPVFLSREFSGNKAEMIEIWKTTSQDLKQIIDRYLADEFSFKVHFKWPNGRETEMDFWKTFAHYINHATYHRGQLVTLLRQVGYSELSSTDLATYLYLHEV